METLDAYYISSGGGSPLSSPVRLSVPYEEHVPCGLLVTEAHPGLNVQGVVQRARDVAQRGLCIVIQGWSDAGCLPTYPSNDSSKTEWRLTVVRCFRRSLREYRGCVCAIFEAWLQSSSIFQHAYRGSVSRAVLLMGPSRGTCGGGIAWSMYSRETLVIFLAGTGRDVLGGRTGHL